MTNWLMLFAFGSMVVGIAFAPPVLRRMLLRRTHHRFAAAGLRPGLRVRVMIGRDRDPDWALVTVFVANRTNDVFRLEQIAFSPGEARGVLESDRLLVECGGKLSALPMEAIVRRGPLLPSRYIPPSNGSPTNCNGLTEGTYEYVYLHCPGESGHIAVDVTLRRMHGSGRTITLSVRRRVS